jgi:hypothetical protein
VDGLLLELEHPWIELQEEFEIPFQ